jgi:hypothetical protein
MKKFALIFGWLISLILVASLAANLAKKNQWAAFEVELNKAQAMLAFNHMERYGELESDLTKGCYSEALEKAKISKDLELSLLASFLKDHPSTWLSKYVSERNPALIEQLKTFKSISGSSWKESHCNK